MTLDGNLGRHEFLRSKRQFQENPDRIDAYEEIRRQANGKRFPPRQARHCFAWTTAKMMTAITGKSND